ncbi:MAG: peptidase M14 [Acidovorax sp. SCN 65-28]|uniref:M14 family metallopeptidase n=1 Tax=Acidovorax sp. TaxID=1872122 RepID=UPI00086F4B1D|nr:M14 family zinc carboxypeptidase [Acidovorax sp.]MBN9628749.1 peptidase M14 [Acidovorax sp.]ODS74800.1 MAG: peptidase M14 [Acidovorax sp. SCN 65-28]
MTQHTFQRGRADATPLSRPEPRITRWAAPATLAALLLTACGSTPLPPWPSTPTAQQRSAPAPLPRVQQGTVVPAPLGQQTPAQVPPQRAAVVSSPLPQSAPLLVRDEAPMAPPYGEAVAARFPNPSVVYSTPGLGADRRAFTTNAEVGQWLRSLSDSAPRGSTRTQLLQIGTSQRGEPIQGLLVTRAAGTDPASLDKSGRPTVVLIGQQHGDEPAGSEALLVISRELAQGLLEPLLDRINVVVVPRANPDGAEVGTRVTANGVDMNRDHLLLNTPEARALAQVINDYRPILVVDAHEYTVVGRYLQKFNAIQRYDALLQYTTTANYPEFLTKASQEWFHQPMVAALKAQGLTSDWYYTTSTNLQDKRISMGGTQPDTGRNVHGLKNTVSLLIETRGVGIGRMHIQRRVHAQVTAITSALRTTAERAANLEQVRSFVARDVSALACRDQVVIEAEATPTQRDLDFLDPETGADRSIRVDWNSSLTLRNTKVRARPCGYWLSADASAAVERLRQLGIQVMRVAEPGSVLAESYRETAREAGNRQDVIGTIAGSGDIVRVQVSTLRSAIDAPAGSFYVPLNQPRANLAVAALEPDTQNSYFANHLIQELGQSARVMAVPSLVFEETD